MDYVFDACAMIAFLNDEDGADTVAGLINQAEIGVDRIFMNSVQVLEVYYESIFCVGVCVFWLNWAFFSLIGRMLSYSRHECQG